MACGVCKWFDSDFVPDLEEPEEALGLCTYPASLMPFCMQGAAQRERSAVGPLHGKDCPTYQFKMDSLYLGMIPE